MDEDQDIGIKLKSISDKLRQVGDAEFAEYGLTGPQVGYMSYIRRSGGSISQKDLELATGVSHPTIVGVVTRLSDKGYVTIRIDQKDRRKRIITLTPKAESVTDELEQGGRAMNSRLLRGLKPEEKCELDRMLGIMESNIKDARDSKNLVRVNDVSL